LDWLFSRYKRAPPLTDAQRATLSRELPFVGSLPEDDRARFYDHVRRFLARVRFEGVGMQVDERMKLVVAGCAARLSRNLDFSLYDGVGSVILYPEAVLVPRQEAGPSGSDVVDAKIAAHGVHLAQGAIVLSWAAVQRGLRDPKDGHDTALHELAHAIDYADGGHDGTPPLSARASREWARVFAAHYRALKKRPHAGVLRAYGAVNEAEFFAVATETFFEKPNALRRRQPDLYDALKGFYGADPASTSGGAPQS
jgi:MtfA peptidase